MRMYLQLISSLENVEREYEHSLRVANDIFDLIKKDKILKLQDANLEQTLQMNKLKVSKEDLKECVTDIAKKEDIGECKIQKILHLFSQGDREKIIDKQKTLMSMEEGLRSALLRNGQFLSAVLSSKEARIDAFIQLNETQNKESNIFLNQKF